MKKTSKRKAMVSLVSAVMMLSTTVFASGSLTDFVADDYTVLFSNNEVGNESFEFQNKAFVHNNEVYVPLREAFEVLGVLSNTDSNITWNNGEIDLCVAYEDIPITADTQNGNQAVKSLTYLYNYRVKIGSAYLTINSAPTVLEQDISNTKAMNNAPILKENVTYIPFSYIDCILNSTKHWAVNYSIYDKDKNLITASLYPIDDKTARTTISNYEDKTEKCCKKTEQFFATFEKGDINNMKNYCTKDFVNDYFHNERFLSMTSGTLKTIYSIRTFSNGDYYVHLKMSSDDLADKEGIYYAVFEEQPNGEFLMKSFQESYLDELESISLAKTNINENHSPQYAIEQFFRNVECSQYEQANRYCTNYSKIKDYQTDNIFAPQKIVSNIKVDYAKNSFNEISAEFYTEINDKNQFVHWKFRLIRQNDENYLISGWESITDVVVDKNGNLIKEF